MSSINNTELNENDVEIFSIDQVLYTRKFYEQLYKLSTSNAYDEYCSSPENIFLHNSDVRNICVTILNYLENIYSTSDNKNDAYDCKLLNYWAYNRLNIVLNSNKSTDIKLTFAEIVRIWNDFIFDKLKKFENKTCKPIDNIVNHGWGERKELYEYYVDYYPIKQSVEKNPAICNEFYQYIERKKSLYEYFKKRCSSYSTIMCDEFYDKFDEYNPEKLPATLKCEQVKINERHVAFPIVPQRGNTFSDSETETRETYVDIYTVGASQNLSRKPHPVTMAGNILLGVVATSMASGVLYKFTPIGSMLRNVLGWNTNNMSNINRGDIILYDYATEPFKTNSGREEEHYIGYQPA